MGILEFMEALARISDKITSFPKKDFDIREKGQENAEMEVITENKESELTDSEDIQMDPVLENEMNAGSNQNLKPSKSQV